MDNFHVRVLLVEDDEQAIEAAKFVLEGLGTPIDISVARNGDEARQFLDRDFFDLIVLDLAIPNSETEPSAAPQHGYGIFGHAHSVAPGTPICLLTGSSIEQFADDLVETAHQVDIWGSGVVRTVKLHRKYKLDTFGKEVSPYINGAGRLSDVELHISGTQIDVAADRLLRIFASANHCVRCEVQSLRGGLSDSLVLRIRIFNEAGALIHDAVAKIGSISDVRSEQARYNNFVQRLTPGITPRLLGTYEFGAKSTGAIFYGLAAGHDHSFFDISQKMPEVCGQAIGKTSRGLSAWRDASSEARKRVSDVRARLVTDEQQVEIAAKYDLHWLDDFERRQLQVRWGCVHSDFHGQNVLLTSDGTPAVIDYGDVSEGAVSIDPITLELSALFHPSSPWRDHEWPSAEIAEKWGDVDAYIQGCPYPDFVLGCRAWANELAVGQREMAASAYAYLLRQLKYDGTSKERALNLLAGVRRLWDMT